MTRVLHITRDFPPASKGGISTAVGGIARAGIAGGHEVWVLSFDAWRPKAHPGGMPLPERESQQGIHVQRVRAPHHIEQLKPVVSELAPDVVLVHHGMLWRAATSLAPDAPRVLYAHVIQAEMNRLRGVAKTMSATAQAEALAEADHVAVPSSEAAIVLLGHHPQLAGRVDILPLGAWIPGRSAMSGGGALAGTSVEPANPPPRAHTVIAVSRYDHTKGTADLVEAISLLIAAVPAVQIRVVGGVPDNPRAERRWRARLEEAGGDQVQCLGWLPPDAVRRELAGAAVGLFPSHAETYGLALLEALTAGVAVVATNVAGHRALLADEASPSLGSARGVLVPAQQPQALADAAAALLREPARMRRLSVAAEAFAHTHAWSHLWPTWQRLFDGVMQARQ